MAHVTRGPVLMRVALIPTTLILFVLVSGFLARVGWATGLWPYALAFGLAAAGSAGAFLFARQVPWADPRPMPRPVRLSFAAFAIILTGAGVALLLHASIFPWQLGRGTSVMFGLTFLGAATYFIYGTVDPHWSNAVGQLAGSSHTTWCCWRRFPSVSARPAAVRWSA